MTIGDKKASLIRNDGSNITLNKPITIPSTVTDIGQITEPGWYHGSFTYSVNKDGDNVTDTSNVKNTPAIKIKDELTSGKSYGYDMFVAKTGDYIFNLDTSVFYGKKLANASITWYKVSPLVKDWLDSTDSESALSANCGRLLKEELDTKSPNTHTHDSLKRLEDKRDIATKPSDYKDEFKFVGLKYEKAIGISNNEKYVALFGVNPWNDSSGSGATEIAISDIGTIYIRHQSASIVGDSFGNWVKLARVNDIPSALKNPNILTIQGNGTTLAVYDGSAAKTVNITKSNVGLGSVDNTADSAKSVKYATNAGAVNGYKLSASTSDLTPGSSNLATNQLYFVYE